MYRTLLALLIGITLPGFLAQLLPWAPLAIFGGLWLSVWCIAQRFFTARLRTGLLLVLFFFLGLLWGSWSLHALVANQLDASLEGDDLVVHAVIDAPVLHDDRRIRMLLTPLISPDAISVKANAKKLPQRLQISWYRAPEWANTLTVGDQVMLKVRLKRPRSFVNPAGFDYKLWQLRRGVGAVGYVRSDPANQRLAQNAPVGPRASIGAWLEQQRPVNSGLINALLLGQRGALTDAQRQLLQTTGTSHLIAISGLHIGLAATLGYLLALALGKLLAPLIPWRAHFIAFAGAALAAWAYSALAGFSLPTQRALAMLLLLYLSRVMRRHCGGGLILAAAALVVCSLDPLSVRDAGFWLSFIAVAALILVYDGVLTRGRRWQSLWLPQWVVFVALLVPLGAFFGQVSLVSPIANLVAIPLIGLLVVPFLFAAALCSWVNEPLAAGLLWLADRTLDGFWWWLQLLTRLQTDYRWPISIDWQPRPLGLLLVAIGALVLLLPNSLKLRTAGLLLLLLALCLPRPQAPNLAITVMDVGQGLAVVVKSKNHSLVYDAGPRYSDNFDAGADIIAPLLTAQGVHQLDALVVSHSHADHAGGATGLLQALPITELYLGEPLPALSPADASRATSCHGADALDNSDANSKNALKPWRWDQVEFSFLALSGQRESAGNNASCVLLIEYQGFRVLLTGDIEQSLEAEVVSALAARGETHLDLLIAPHHGSKTSSSAAFVAALSPSNLVFSAGFNNRHGHPHPQVVKRYQRSGAQIFNTAYDGAVSFTIDATGALRRSAQRQLEPRPWRD